MAAFEDHLVQNVVPLCILAHLIHVTPLPCKLHIFTQEQVPLLNLSLFNIYTTTVDIAVLGIHLIENNGNYYNQAWTEWHLLCSIPLKLIKNGMLI